MNKILRERARLDLPQTKECIQELKIASDALNDAAGILNEIHLHYSAHTLKDTIEQIKIVSDALKAAMIPDEI